MAADKKFNLSFKTDIKGLKDAYKALQDLATMGNKVAASFKGVNLVAGGGAGAQGGVSKALLAEKKLFEDLGKAGEKLSKIFSQNVIKSQVDLGKALKNTDKELTGLITKYEVSERRLQHNRLKYREAKLTANRDAAMAELQERSLERLRISSALGGGGGGGGDEDGRGGFGRILAGGIVNKAIGASPLGSALSGMGLGGLVAASAPLMIAGAAAGGLALGAKLGVSMLLAGGGAAPYQLAQQAAQGQFATSYMGASGGGDRSLAAGIAAGRNMPQAYAGVGVAQKLWDPATAWLGSRFTRLTQGKMAADAEYERRLSNSRVEGEMEVQRRLAETMGPAAQVGNWQLDNYATITDFTKRFGTGAWDRMNAAGARNLYGADRTRALAEPMAALVGTRHAEALATRAAGTYQYGWNPGRVGNIWGRSGAARGDLIGATGGYGLDVEMRSAMAEGVLPTMGPESMMYEGKGDAMARAMAGGVFTADGAQGMRETQQVISGMGLHGAVMGGHNAYQKTYNIAAAASALGAGADPYKLNFLATQMKDPAVLSDIANGTLPPQFKALGITLNQAQMAAKDIEGGIMNRFYDTGGNQGDPAYNRMRAARAAGGFGQYLKGMKPADAQKAISELAPLLAQTEMDLFGGDVGKAEGYLMAERGLRAPGAAARGGGKPGKPPEMSDLERTKMEEEKGLNESIRNLKFGVDDVRGEAVKLRDYFKLVREGTGISRQEKVIPKERK